MEKETPSDRGRTGSEGSAVKTFGALAVVVALLWFTLTWLFAESGAALTLPISLGAIGVIVFLIGRSLARPISGTPR